MKLSLSTAPDGAVEIIRAALADLHGSKLCPLALRALQPDQFSIGVPHLVYQLDLGKDGTLAPDQLRCDGARFLIKAGGKLVAVAHVTTGKDGKYAGELSAISFGPRAASFADAIALAEKLPGDIDMEIALLNVAPLHLHGLLLLPIKGPSQPLVVALDAADGATLQAPVSLQDYCTALAPAAAAFVAAAAQSPDALA